MNPGHAPLTSAADIQENRAVSRHSVLLLLFGPETQLTGDWECFYIVLMTKLQRVCIPSKLAGQKIEY